MDEASGQSIRVLECIAGCNEKLIELSQWLRSFPAITASRGFECRAYDSGTTLEGYVEVELDEKTTLCWWLDVTWNNANWLIQSSVLLNNEAGQTRLKDFPSRMPTTVDDFINQMNEATSDLIAYAQSMDLMSNQLSG